MCRERCIVVRRSDKAAKRARWAAIKDSNACQLFRHAPCYTPCYILPIFEKLSFDLEALLSAQAARLGDPGLATCVTTVLSCTCLWSLKTCTKSIDPVRFSIGSHVASLMG